MVNSKGAERVETELLIMTPSSLLIYKRVQNQVFLSAVRSLDECNVDNEK